MNLNVLGVGIGLARLAMDAATMRHEAIASNIANVNSAGYVPQKVSFEEFLNSAEIERSNLKDISDINRPQFSPDYSSTGLPAKLALDMEIVKLNANVVQYQALARSISRSLSIINLAILEGRR